jgi:GR25 family glycosyltransferase involved in LPS biosynthesis
MFQKNKQMILWFWFDLFLILILILVVCLMQRPKSNPPVPFRRKDLDVFIISLEERKAEFFDRLAQSLAMYDMHPRWEKGIVGKGLNLDQLPDGVRLSTRYRRFFENNRIEFQKNLTTKRYDGHLGCSLTHLRITRNLTRMTMVLEDDAILTPDFATRLDQQLSTLQTLDPDWDILLLGLTCQYNHSVHCHLNDGFKPVHGIVRIKYFFGGWAYVIHQRSTADKILKEFDPMPWHFDLTCADMARKNRLKVYACIPVLVLHPGVLSVSSFQYTQKGDTSICRYRSDTNN